MDNACNNDIFMATLEGKLTSESISFNKIEWHIRYRFKVYILYHFFLIHNFSCFPHIVNLAVKTVLGNITKIELAAADAQEFDPAIAQQPDSIAQLCTIVWRVCIFLKVLVIFLTLLYQIRATSLRRQIFSEIVQGSLNQDLQLLRDVDT